MGMSTRPEHNTAVSFSPTDDVCISVDLWLVVRVFGELPKFIELSLWVLVCCRDTGVDADLGQTFCGLDRSDKVYTFYRARRKQVFFTHDQKTPYHEQYASRPQ